MPELEHMRAGGTPRVSVSVGRYFFFFSLITFRTNHGEEISVPDLSKMQLVIAEEKLAELGLEIILLDTVDFKENMHYV